jgi:hypothetical protein
LLSGAARERLSRSRAGLQIGFGNWFLRRPGDCGKFRRACRRFAARLRIHIENIWNPAASCHDCRAVYSRDRHSRARNFARSALAFQQ